MREYERMVLRNEMVYARERAMRAGSILSRLPGVHGK
jgi:hypothetical protein